MIRSNTPSVARPVSSRRSLGHKIRWSAVALLLAAVGRLEADPTELKTQGNQIVEKISGKRVRLVGANLSGLEDNFNRNFLNSLDVLKGTWKANIVRLPVNDGLWLNSNLAARDAYRAQVNAILDRARELDIYVVLDLHKYAIPTWAANTFWADAANLYKNQSHILFGLYNEPHTTQAKALTWALWKNGDSAGPGMQTLLQTVRGQGANNIVLVGGLDFAFDLRGIMPGYGGQPNGYALTDTATGNGVVYDSHVYPWKDYIQGVSANASLYYPLILGEFGHPSGTTVGFLPGETFEAYPTWMPRMMGWINTNNFHWIGWNFSDGSDPAMLSNWSYKPSPHLGEYLLTHLQSYSDPTEHRVVGGTVIGSPGTSSNPTSPLITDDKSGAIVPFSNTYAYYFSAATASGGWTGLDLGIATRITEICYMPAFKLATGPADMVGGVFQGSNTADFSGAVTLHTVTIPPDGSFNGNTGKFTSALVTDPTPYRYVRYVGPTGKRCRVASIRFYTGDDSGPGVNEDVIIIDNDETHTGFTETPSNSWPNGGSGIHGNFWVSDGNTGKGKTLRYTPNFTRAGRYEVFAIWDSSNPRCNNVPYVITHAGVGSPTTVWRDQNEFGRTWRSLGTYTFAAGDGGNVLLNTANTTGYITADAMKFVYRPAVDPIIMDKDAGNTPGIVAVGGWAASNTSGGHENDSYHDGGTGTGKSVTFSPSITEAGQYKVSLWWTQGTNRAANAPVTVNYSGGSFSTTVNQKTNGGVWNDLPGTFTFAAGTAGNVVISNTGALGHVIADAVKFEKVN